MSPSATNIEGFAGMFPLEPSCEESLREAIDRLKDASPFARIEGTHFARLVLVPRLRDSHDDLSLGPACLFFATEFDQPLDDYVERLREVVWEDKLRAEESGEPVASLDRVFASCLGYPGAADWQAKAFRAWVQDHRVKPRFSILGHAGRSVFEIKQSIELRDRIVRLAMKMQGHPPQDLKQEWEASDLGLVVGVPTGGGATPEPSAWFFNALGDVIRLSLHTSRQVSQAVEPHIPKPRWALGLIGFGASAVEAPAIAVARFAGAMRYQATTRTRR